MRQTLELLMKMRKGKNNVQAASDRGKMNEDENAVAVSETPSPAVTALGDGPHEAGSATKPGSKKRPRDKDRSVSALEMAMSQRLTEQVFDMCF
jgi:hypothetical protein